MGLLNLFKKDRHVKQDRRVFVIGLDCAEPSLLFERWAADLPNFTALRQRGLWGRLKSCTPAITVPAWSSMLSSRDPGVLGIYGFRNRADRSYGRMTTATSTAIKEKRVWDYLGEASKCSVLVGVPQTFPTAPLNGCVVSDFLTPDRDSAFAYPPALRDEVLKIAPEYDFDVPQFRTDDKAWLLKQIHKMTDGHFAVIDGLMADKPWDFFMSVEIGVDRMHHGFWSHFDKQHFRYQPGNPYESAIHDYYVRVDRKVGEWLGKLPPDTAVLVVSDHGAKRMDGGLCVNEWLWRNGYLAFKQDPPAGKITPFEKLEVDWSRTKAWGSGGYYGRVFLNVQGREPQGMIPAGQYEAARDELARALAAIPGPDGQDIGTRVFKPQEIYAQVNGIAPDLIVYFGDLLWRSVGSLGHGSAYTFSNDTGPDDCNHAEQGLFICADPQSRTTAGQELQGAQLMDIAPTILETMGLPIPASMQGRPLSSIVNQIQNPQGDRGLKS